MTEGVWHWVMLGDGLGVAAKLVKQEDGRWIVTELFLRGDRITASDLRNVQPARFEAFANANEGLRMCPERSRLTRPDGTDPDGFYRSVAAAYRDYLTTTRAPAAAMADEAEVPVATVHRWIREARKRGFLPAGEQGRAG